MVRSVTDDGEEVSGIEEIRVPEIPVQTSAWIIPVEAHPSPVDSGFTVIDTASVAELPELSIAFAVSE